MNEPADQRGRKGIACGIVIIAITWLTFGRVVTHDFVGGWDDGPLIVDNPMINPPTARGLAEIWTRPHARMYIPAVYSTWWGLAQVASVPANQPGATTLNPYVFHAANLLVHTLSVLMVFAIVRALVRNDLAACAGAVLFAIHPLQVEPVAWATGMKDLLCGFFSLLAVWQYVRFRDCGCRGRLAIALVAFALALLAKPSAVVVPLIAMIIDVLMLGRTWLASVRVLWPAMLVSVAWAIVTPIIQPTPELAGAPLWQRPIIVLDSIGFYLVKLHSPARLGIDYGLRPDVIVKTHCWLPAVVMLILAAVVRNRWLTASLAIFVVGILPVLGLTPFVFQWLSTVADRYVYLSMLGPAIGLAKVWNVKRMPAPIAMLLIGLATLSFVQAGVWKNVPTLTAHALAINPNAPSANNTMGDLHFQRDEFDRARDYFERAIQVRPAYLVARDNLASTYVRLDRPDDAVLLMKETLELRRNLPRALRQSIKPELERLITVLRGLNRTAEAEAYEAELRALSAPAADR